MNEKLKDILDSLQKSAEDQGVTQEHASVAGGPSSATSDGMEERNEGFGKEPEDTDYEKAEEAAQETGKPQVETSGANVTSEPEGMPDLSLPKAASGESNKQRLMGLFRSLS